MDRLTDDPGDKTCTDPRLRYINNSDMANNNHVLCVAGTGHFNQCHFC